MSLILDALNRAEQERNNQSAIPTLNSVHMSAETIPEVSVWARYMPIWFVLAAVIVAAGGWIGFKTLTASTATVDIKSMADNHEAARTDVVPSEPTVVQASEHDDVQSIRNEAIQTNSVDRVVSSAPSVTTITAVPAVVEQLYDATDNAVPDEVASLYGDPEPEGESVSIVDPFASTAETAPSELGHVTKRVGASTAIAERTFDDLALIQDFNELPWTTKQQVPTISYQRHNYLAEAVSTVVINGQTLGEGNVLNGTELVVQEIVKDGVVMRFGATVFKLRALNGWINM